MKKVLLWDPTKTGHHSRWMKILINYAPNDLELLVPDWLDPKSFSGLRNLISPIPQSQGSEARSLLEAIRLHSVHGVVVTYGSYLIDSLALRPRIPDVPFIAIDLAAPQVLIHPARLHLRPASVARAMVSLLGRESLVRRTCLHIAAFDRVALRVGTRKLRARTHFIPSPLEQLTDYPASRSPHHEHRIVVTGSIGARKGIDLLVKSLELLAKREEIDPKAIEVVIAGPVSKPFSSELNRLSERLRLLGFPTLIEDRFLKDEELSSLLRTSTVVALPYKTHRGPSGLLSSMAGVTGPAVIAPEFGLMGEHAAAMGALTFTEGSFTSLAKVLLIALREKRSALKQLPDSYSSEIDFAKSVWSLLGDD